MEDTNFNKGLSVDDYFRKTDLIYLSEVNCLPALGPWVQRLCSMPKWLLFELGEGRLELTFSLVFNLGIDLFSDFICCSHKVN